MTAIDPQISAFLEEHHVLALATCLNNEPYCASCFYVFRPQEGDLIFASERTTRHGRELQENARAAAAIHHQTQNIQEIQGVQITGLVRLLDAATDSTRARQAYLRRFPFLEELEAPLWRFQPRFIKMTDNTVSFGYKRIWRDHDPAD